MRTRKEWRRGVFPVCQVSAWVNRQEREEDRLQGEYFCSRFYVLFFSDFADNCLIVFPENSNDGTRPINGLGQCPSLK